MLNLVCLMGQLEKPVGRESPFRPGWSSLLLRVPRSGPRGEQDAGVFDVELALPPGLAWSEVRAHGVGACVAIVGMLVSDTDYSAGSPRIRHAVVPRSIERISPAEPTSPD